MLSCGCGSTALHTRQDRINRHLRLLQDAFPYTESDNKWKEVSVTSGTSSLDTRQFTEFLNNIQSDAAAEFGIRLPTPEDMYWDEFQNEYK
jgi:hypothetical protein